MQRLTLLRLEKETAELERNPIENVLVKRVGTFNFHFCLYNLSPPYLGGFYHGLLELHQNYPFRAPKLLFYTPSGRFQINTPICTTFTNFHQESWTSAWNVRTLLLATISYMYTQEHGFGCRKDSDAVRRVLARQSKQFNLKKPQFIALFADSLPKEEPSNDQKEEGEGNFEMLQQRNGEGGLAELEIVRARVGVDNRGRKKLLLVLFMLVVVLLILVWN